MSYLLLNTKLISESTRTKLNYELLYEEYKVFENNCSLLQSKSAVLQ